MTLTLRKERTKEEVTSPPPSSGLPCVGRPRALRYHFLEIGSASLSSWLVRAGRSAPPLLLGPRLSMTSASWISHLLERGLLDLLIFRFIASLPRDPLPALLAPTRTHEPP